ncbi:pelargonidin 3-O-(6-caffeoylglucoside) 5-O-(6-O-malonylglucoside) 4'''-malonyltransferase-like [Rutidosis leptorrhynchoides]|uniref:pelargonidin 3-O-(6-caffeoylglucoside) 5-O-(6-O-malonylglucoside) 4'''-malonyltransferase-like n=1 Tax=Rutidosis leptorrhynchoides TaxID=125765 RepID=UPI003A993B8F
MAVHIVTKQSKKHIKPSTPNPLTLCHYKIGFIDELAPSLNISVVLFYSVNHNHISKFVSKLEKSLEKTLKLFPPLAGRYVAATHAVDCNDQGVDFIQAKVNMKLEDIVGCEANLRLVNELVPLQPGEVDQVNDPLLAIQVTAFECGGIALGVSISHRIADASTISTFLNEWAYISREEEYEVEHIIGSGFNSSLLFPSRGLDPFLQGFTRSKSDDNELSMYFTKKISFSENEILNLKEKIMLNSRNGNLKLSKAQVVSAIIWNAYNTIDRRINVDHPRDSVFIQAINLRGKTSSLIPNDSCGNFWGILATECKSGNIETIEELSDLLNNSVNNGKDYYAKLRHDNEEGQKMVLISYEYLATIPPTKNVIVISSWCKFLFYEVDFGFGKPVWVNCGSMHTKNLAYLIEGLGGNGIEAYMSLEHKDVPHLKEALYFNTFVN